VEVLPMRGPKPQTPIVLTEPEVQRLKQVVCARTNPQGQVVRAHIVLLAYSHPDWSNQQIAQTIHQTDRTVRKWRRRWVETHALDDLPRPGAPLRFPPSHPRPGDCDRL
jgi:hypothetical protein